MRKMSKKLLVSIFSLMVAIVVASTSTYAYFQMNREAWVSNLGLEIATGDGILVSVDGSHYYESISKEDLYKAVVAKYKNWTLKSDGILYDKEVAKASTDEEVYKYFKQIALVPVTSLDGKSFEDNSHMPSSTIDSSYVAFDLFFMAEEKPASTSTSEITVGFSKTGTKSTSGQAVPATEITSPTLSKVKTVNDCYSYDKTTGEAVKHNSSMVNGVHNPNLSTLNVSAKDAIRFSTATYKSLTTSSGTTELVNQTKIYELNEGLGSYATNLNETMYGVNTPGAYAAKYDATKNAALTYSNNINDGNYESLDYLSEVPQTYKSFNTIEACEIVKLNQANNYSAKVTFSIWLEGFDADCIDPIVGNAVDCYFSFTSSTSNKTATVTVDKNYAGASEPIKYQLSANVTSTGAKTYMDQPAIPFREGYRFDGWYTDFNCTDGNEFDFSKEVISDTLLFAKWTEATYKIRFDALGGTGSLPSITSYTNSTLNDENNPTSFTLPALSKEGYVFKGWLETISKQIYVADTIINKDNIGSITNKNYVAVWELLEYQIEYSSSPDGAVFSAENKTSYTVLDEFIIQNPTLEGYIFMGWKVNDEIELKTNVVINTGSTGDIKLHAIFTAETYTIKYDANGGSGVMSNLENIYYADKVSLSDNQFSHTKQFLGWATTNDAVVAEFNNLQRVSLIAANTEKVVILYAVWGN